MMGPVNNNLGYLQYTILAIVGGYLAITSQGSLLTLGGLAAFLLLSRKFNMPIGQISNQINAIVMALAGAERIFELMDEESEADEGYVTLVNAKQDENGNDIIVVGNEMPIDLVFDHRACDFGDLVPFINRLEDIFKNPEQMYNW